MADKENFSITFSALTGFEPMPWQENLYVRFTSDFDNNLPACCDFLIGLGKISL
jgi:hypothetical protein